MKKVKIGNKFYDVVTREEFVKMPVIPNPGEVAIMENGYVVPYQGLGGTQPGFYASPQANYVVPPTQDQMQTYSDSNVLNFDSCENVKQIMEMNASLKALENDMLADTNDVYTPQIKSSNTPEMAGLRQAIIDKHIDINKYQDRFGGTFTNDKRAITNNDSITLDKLKMYSTCLDIKGTLILEDMEGCPNPIGRKIKIPLNYVEEEGDN